MVVPVPAPVPMIDPLQLSLNAVANLISCCLVGIFLEKIGILDQKAISTLSTLVYHLFQPCLLFTNIVKTLASTSAIANVNTNVVEDNSRGGGNGKGLSLYSFLSSLTHGKSVFILLPCLAAFQVGTARAGAGPPRHPR